MKPATRRLGRGLGSFLDFAPADEDGATRVGDVIASGEVPSILTTSATQATAATVLISARPAVTTRPAKTSPVAPRAPLPAEEGISTPAPHAVVASTPKAPSTPPESPPDEAPFLDEVVVGLAFPDVELE